MMAVSSNSVIRTRKISGSSFLGNRLRIATFLLILLNVVSPAYAFTLEDAIVSAFHNYEPLRAARARVALSKAQTDQTNSLRKPQLSVQFQNNIDGLNGSDSSSRTRNTSLSVSARQLVYDGGQTRLQVEALHKLSEVGEVQLEKEKADLALRVVLTALDHSRQIKSKIILSDSARLLSEQLRGSQLRFESGTGTLTDVAFSEAQLSLAQSRLQATDSQIAASEIDFQRLVGLSISELESDWLPTRDLVPATLNIALEAAMLNNIELSTFGPLQDAARLQLSSAKRQNAPIVSLGLTAAKSRFESSLFVESINRDEFTGFVSITLPLYQGGQRSSSIRAGLAALEVVDANMAARQADLARDIEMKWSELELSIAQESYIRTGVRAAELSFKGAKKERDVGLRPTSDVLRAEEQLLRTKLDELELEYRIYSTQIELLWFIGLIDVVISD